MLPHPTTGRLYSIALRHRARTDMIFTNIDAGVYKSYGTPRAGKPNIILYRPVFIVRLFLSRLAASTSSSFLPGLFHSEPLNPRREENPRVSMSSSSYYNPYAAPQYTGQSHPPPGAAPNYNNAPPPQPQFHHNTSSNPYLAPNHGQGHPGSRPGSRPASPGYLMSTPGYPSPQPTGSPQPGALNHPGPIPSPSPYPTPAPGYTTSALPHVSVVQALPPPPEHYFVEIVSATITLPAPQRSVSIKLLVDGKKKAEEDVINYGSKKNEAVWKLAKPV
jgi:hypothetical protein